MKTETTNATTIEQLPESFKTKWVAALRSGRYNQGFGMMYDPKRDSYDTIGVAHRIAGVSQSILSKKKYPTSKHKFLPNMLASEMSPAVEKMISFNDKGLSFRWIASYIERHM